MNMKKSIAGVMAGALAVSAIATTASAWTGGTADQEQIVLSYDLNEHFDVWSTGSVRLTYSYAPRTDNPYIVTGLTTGGTKDVRIAASFSNFNYYRIKSINVTGTSTKQFDSNGDGRVNTLSKTFTDIKTVGADGKNDVVMLGSSNVRLDTTTGNVSGYTIPFSVTGSNKDVFPMDGFKIYAADDNAGADTPAAGKYTLTAKKVTAYNAASAAVSGMTIGKGAEDATAYGATTHLIPATMAGYDNMTEAAAAVGNLATGDTFVGFLTGDGEITPAANKVGGVTGKIYLQVNRAAKTANYSVAATEDVLGEYDSYADAVTAQTAVSGACADIDGTPSTADVGKYDKATLKVNAPAATDPVDPEEPAAPTQYGFNNYTITMEYITAPNDWDGDWRIGGDWAVTKDFNGIEDMDQANFSVNQTQANHGDYYKPMRTNWDSPAELVSYLTKLGYTYPQAVLNDVIANNENVAFTFTTAQSYVDNRQYVTVNEYVNGNEEYVIKDNGNGTYDVIISNPAGGKSVHRNLKGFKQGSTIFVTNPYYGVSYSENKDNDFVFDVEGNKTKLWYHPVFSQDLYQKFTWNNNNGYKYTGPNGSQESKDQFGSYASIWNTNLNSAGLVANSKWTMQLSDVDAFEWGDQTVTFFWDAITDEAKVTNAANFLTTLQLYTPAEWYWEKLDVAVGAAIAEEVAPDAPLEETAEEVSEEETEEEVIEEEEDTDFVEEEDPFEEEDFTEEEEFTEEETEEETEEVTEPVEEAPDTIEVDSPKTGNAPVALAVIPVALAAAAVVAKKRK